MTDFLPDLPEADILTALHRSPGNELRSGKFSSSESSTALVANAFGWFLNRPEVLPPLPGVPAGRADALALEAEMRFPWRGGRHPWLDVGITTPTTLIGVESKRYEPFRPGKATVFSEAYDRPLWPDGMARYTAMRLGLTAGTATFKTLDAAQLVKHAYGLRNQAEKQARGAVLVYLHAEPATWASGKPVDPARIALHRKEVARFAATVKGDDVVFVPLRWADLVAQWAAEPKLAAHVAAVRARFGPL